MGEHEKRARNLKQQGNNCSYSIYTAFMEDKRLNGNYPEPRSIDGKCGALLTSLKILEEMGCEDKKENLEKRFIDMFGYSKCIELMTHGARCSEYVGECARMLDEFLQDE